MTAPAPQLLIFDLDGTLLDTAADIAAAVNRVRRHYALEPLPPPTIAGYIGDGVRALISRVLPGREADLDDAVRLQKAFYLERLHDQTRPYPGVVDGLAQLHAAGHCLAVATNKATEATEALLRHFGVRVFFAHVLGGGSVPELKPHPQMLCEIMQRAGIDAGRTWMIGDNRTDLEAARRAGVRSVFVTYGIGEDGGEPATLRCGSFAELSAAFLPAGGPSTATRAG